MTSFANLPRFAALKALPPEYTLAQRLEVGSRRIFWLLNLGSLLPLVIGAAFFLGVDRLLIALNLHPLITIVSDKNSDTLLVIAMGVLAILLIVIHELCHGLAFQAFGAKPRYGLNMRKFVAYASADDYYFSRDAYLIIALAPLVLISVGTILLMALTGGGLRFLMALLGAVNAGSSIGDLWFVVVCLHYPRDLLVRDYGDGAELFKPTPFSPHSGGTEESDRL
jgi:hypothetical protein